MGLSTKQVLLVVFCGLAGNGCESTDEVPPVTDESPTEDAADSSGDSDAEGDADPGIGADAPDDTGVGADEGSDSGGDGDTSTIDDLRGVHVYTTRDLGDGSTEVVCDETLDWRTARFKGDTSFQNLVIGYIGGCEGCEYELSLEGPSRTSIYEACGPGVFDEWADLAELDSGEYEAIRDARLHYEFVAQLAFADSLDPAIHSFWEADYGVEYGWTNERVRLHYLAHYPTIDADSESSLLKWTFWEHESTHYGDFYGEYGFVHGFSYGWERQRFDAFESDRTSVEWSGSHTHTEDATLTTQVRARVFFGDACPIPRSTDGVDADGAPVPGSFCDSTENGPLDDHFAEVIDCDGCCVRESTHVSYWGDGICDDTSTSHINLNCAAFDFDAGDCGEESE